VTTHADLGLDLDVCDTDAVADRRDELVAAVGPRRNERSPTSSPSCRGAATTADRSCRRRGDMDRQTRGWRAGVPPVLADIGLGRVRDLDAAAAGPADLATALDDYANFVAAWNEWVGSLSGVLDGVSAEFPEPDSTDGVVAERDRVLDRVRETCSVMAGEIYRYEGDDYGTFPPASTATDGS